MRAGWKAAMRGQHLAAHLVCSIAAQRDVYLDGRMAGKTAAAMEGFLDAGRVVRLGNCLAGKTVTLRVDKMVDTLGCMRVVRLPAVMVDSRAHLMEPQMDHARAAN